MVSTSEGQKLLDKFWDALLGEGLETSARTRVESVCEETGAGLPVVIAQLGLSPDGTVVKAYQDALDLDRTTLKNLPGKPRL